jgi:anti-sigma B factor antagonist
VKLNIRKAGNATIIEPEGSLKLGESEQQFRDAVRELTSSGVTQLIVNLAGVPEMDSSGIGAVVRAYVSLNKIGGKCVICAPTPRVMMVMKIARLDTILNPVKDEAAALALI